MSCEFKNLGRFPCFGPSTNNTHGLPRSSAEIMDLWRSIANEALTWRRVPVSPRRAAWRWSWPRQTFGSTRCRSASSERRFMSRTHLRGKNPSPRLTVTARYPTLFGRSSISRIQTSSRARSRISTEAAPQDTKPITRNFANQEGPSHEQHPTHRLRQTRRGCKTH
jgi:hypothetical protein